MNTSIIPVSFLAACMVGCQPTNSTNPDSSTTHTSALKSTEIEVNHLIISKYGFEIHGNNFEQVTKVSLHDGINKMSFETKKVDETTLKAHALSTMKLAFNKAYELIISSAHGETRFPITFELTEELILELRGEKGEQGQPGQVGPQGPMGPQGSKGDKGDTGEKGEQGLAGMQGPQGLQGPMGATGPQGEKGDAGEKAIAPILPEPDKIAQVMDNWTVRIGNNFIPYSALTFRTGAKNGTLYIEGNSNFYGEADACEQVVLAIGINGVVDARSHRIADLPTEQDDKNYVSTSTSFSMAVTANTNYAISLQAKSLVTQTNCKIGNRSFKVQYIPHN